MKAALHLSAALGLLSLSACSYSTMGVTRLDGATGRMTSTVYTKYYDDGNWIVRDRLGMSVVIDHEKTEIPILHGLQQSIGALGPGDLEATGKVTIYLWNLTPHPEAVKILRVSSGAQSFSTGGLTFNAVPGHKSGGAAGSLKISNYGTEVPITVEYELNGKKSRLSLTPHRRTAEELDRYHGRHGTPPYPWGKQVAATWKW